MFQFKDLIFEQENFEAAKELNRLLQTKFRNDLPKLYRATKREFENPYKVFKLEKRKSKPKGTDYSIQVLVDFLSERRFKDYPKRSESKFARTGKAEGSGVLFGSNTYLIFPDRTANIYSFEDDTLNLRSDIEAMMRPLNSIFNKQNYSKLVKLGNFFGNAETKAERNSMKSFLESNWQKIINELDRAIENGNYKQNKVGKGFLESINKYFSEMKEGVVKGSDEVVFDGDYYLYVKKDFFNEWFTRIQGEWFFKSRKK